MKTRTKVIIEILVVLFGMLLLINHLFDKKIEIDIHQEDYVQASARAEFFEGLGDNSILETQTTTTRINTTKKVNKPKKALKIANTGTYKITHYGADCKKCSGITASGHNAKESIYYVDKEYKKVRIVATSKDIPLYSIIKIKNYKLGGDIIAIVLDRGVGKGVIDLLVDSEITAKEYGIQKNVEIEILRTGK